MMNVSTDQKPTIQAPRLKCLLAEDNPVNSIFQETLIRSSGIEVISVKNGKDALKELIQGNYHFAILDLNMPELSGFEVTKYFRRKEKHSKRLSLPIFALTAEEKNRDLISKCLKSGFFDIYEKPLKNHKFRELLGTWMKLNTQDFNLNKNSELQASQSALRIFLRTCKQEETDMFNALHEYRFEDFLESLGNFKGSSLQWGLKNLYNIISDFESLTIKSVDNQIMNLEVKFSKELTKSIQYLNNWIKK